MSLARYWKKAPQSSSEWLVSHMDEEMAEGLLIQCYETHPRVIKSDKGPTADHWMWVRAEGRIVARLRSLTWPRCAQTSAQAIPRYSVHRRLSALGYGHRGTATGARRMPRSRGKEKSVDPSPVLDIKAIVPAKDFELSKQLYVDLGFTINWSSADIAEQIGHFRFLLQKFYLQQHTLAIS